MATKVPEIFGEYVFSDKVMRDNAELIEKYRNSPNALKYELLKNFKVEEAAL